MVKEVKELSVKEIALQELKKEQVKEATDELKELYRKLAAAEKVVRNIQREIDDYCEEIES